MTAEQLETLVKLMRGDMSSVAVRSAKLVLVDGLSQAEVAKKLGVRASAINNGVKRYKEANKEIRRVYFIN